TVAHEFRTPLTSLRMANHILLEGTVGAVSEKQADLLQAAREDCERLQDIVDDLLDLARIQAGKVEVQPAAISAKSLVEGALANRSAAASAAKIQLAAEVGEPVLPVLAGAERIALVLDNLIGNAVRHSVDASTASTCAASSCVRARARTRRMCSRSICSTLKSPPSCGTVVAVWAIRSGNDCGCSTCAGERMTARSMALRSSRTFPG